MAKYGEQLDNSVEEYKKDIIDDNMERCLKAMFARRKAVESLVDAAVVAADTEAEPEA